MNERYVSKATLGRLPTYLRFLKSISNKTDTISATAVAKALNLGEVQVRKDLAAVSSIGKPKVGYLTDELIKRLEEYLGCGNKRRAVIVGAGKLGGALLDYIGFGDYGLEIAAAFDISVKELKYSDSGKPIYPMDEFERFCRDEKIKIGIITVPGSAAQRVCDLMVKNNILAIWSFAPCSLSVPDGIVVQHEDIALSLAYLDKQI